MVLRSPIHFIVESGVHIGIVGPAKAKVFDGTDFFPQSWS